MKNTNPTPKKITCPVCAEKGVRFDDKVGMYICTDCGHEWTDDTQKDIQQAEIGTGD